MQEKAELAEAANRHFLALAPSAGPLFQQENIVPRERLLNALAMIVRSVEDVDAFDAAAKKLALKRLGNGNAPDHAPLVAKASFLAMKDCLGTRFSDEAQIAWKTALDRFSPRVEEWMQKLAKENETLLSRN